MYGGRLKYVDYLMYMYLCVLIIYIYIYINRFGFMVFNATFKNISVISWG